MKSNLHDLAIKVGFEVVNADDGFTNYEYNEKISNVESVSYIIKVEDETSLEKSLLTFEAIIDVLPKKLKKKIYKLTKRSFLEAEGNALELALFAIDEFKNKSYYFKLKEYGDLLGVDIEELGYSFTYYLTKREYSEIISQIEQKIPMEYAVAVGKIKNIDYKIGFIKNSDIIKKK